MMFSAGFNTLDDDPDHDDPHAVFGSFEAAVGYLLYNLNDSWNMEQKLIHDGHSDKDPGVVEDEYQAAQDALNAASSDTSFRVIAGSFQWWIQKLDITDEQQESMEAMHRGLMEQLSKGSKSGHAAEPEPF